MRVIQKDRNFVLKVGKEVVERRGLIEIYVVEQVHDSWVWLDSKRAGLKGWAKADSVVPLDEAVAYFTRKIQANRDDPIPYVIRAKVWEAKKELDIALGDLNEALRLDPTHAWVYNWRGVLWKEKKAYDRAVADFTEALRLESSLPLRLSESRCHSHREG